MVDSERLAERCRADGEFRMASRYWTGGVVLDIGGQSAAIRIVDGECWSGDATARSGTIELSGPRDVWEKILAAVPPPFYNDIMPARAMGLRVTAEPETLWQYYPAVRRLVDLLREEANRDVVTI